MDLTQSSPLTLPLDPQAILRSYELWRSDEGDTTRDSVSLLLRRKGAEIDGWAFLDDSTDGPRSARLGGTWEEGRICLDVEETALRLGCRFEGALAQGRCEGNLIETKSGQTRKVVLSQADAGLLSPHPSVNAGDEQALAASPTYTVDCNHGKFIMKDFLGFPVVIGDWKDIELGGKYNHGFSFLSLSIFTWELTFSLTAVTVFPELGLLKVPKNEMGPGKTGKISKGSWLNIGGQALPTTGTIKQSWS